MVTITFMGIKTGGQKQKKCRNEKIIALQLR